MSIKQTNVIKVDFVRKGRVVDELAYYRLRKLNASIPTWSVRFTQKLDKGMPVLVEDK